MSVAEAGGGAGRVNARSAKLGRVEGTGEFWTGEDRTRGLLQDGVGEFIFPADTPFAEADDAFALGEKAIFQGSMHDPKSGWSQIGASVIVSGASFTDEGPYVVKLKMAGKPQALEG